MIGQCEQPMKSFKKLCSSADEWEKKMILLTTTI